MGSHVIPKVVLHADLGRMLDLLIRAVQRGYKTSSGHRAGHAHLTLAAHLRARDARVLLVENADSCRREEEADQAAPAFLPANSGPGLR